MHAAFVRSISRFVARGKQAEAEAEPEAACGSSCKAGSKRGRAKWKAGRQRDANAAIARKTKMNKSTPYNNDYEPLTLNGKENAGLQITTTATATGVTTATTTQQPRADKARQRNAAMESKKCDS